MSIPRQVNQHTASFWQRLTFAWATQLVQSASRRMLTINDLLTLPPEDEPGACDRRFTRYLERARGSTKPVQVALWMLMRELLFRRIVLGTIATVLFSALPWLLKGFLTACAESGVQDPLTRAYAVLLVLVAGAAPLFLHHMIANGLRVGGRARAVLTTTLYRKMLKITPRARAENSSGEIINLMGTHANRIVLFIHLGDAIWRHPLQLLIGCVSLYLLVGSAAWSGLGVLLAFFGLSTIVARRQSEARRSANAKLDTRVSLMNEILTHMRLVKLYAWEVPVAQRIKGARQAEVAELVRCQRLWAISLSLLGSSSVAIGIAVFTTLLASNERLTAAHIFPVLGVIASLRIALSMLPEMVALFVEARLGLHAIEKFYAQPDVGVLPNSPLPRGTIELKDFSGTWEGTNPALSSVSVSIAPGELVCVVGPVGGGKSALLTAMLGGLETPVGRCEVSGDIAYVSQQPWIQSDTIRANVLFNRKMDEDRYRRALAVSALSSDLDRLPLGDMTVVGERGVNLSGGQRQRVALARAYYSDADVYLLDDPLSALDPGVAGDVYADLIWGALSGTTRVLVTHRLEFLSQADRVIVLSGGTITAIGSLEELRASRGYLSELLLKYGASLDSGDQIDEQSDPREPAKDSASTPLIVEEEQQEGAIPRSVYLSYLNAFAPGVVLPLVVILFLSRDLFGALLDGVYAWWTHQATIDPILFILGALSVGACASLAAYFRAQVSARRGLIAGLHYHDSMLEAVLRAPMTFFESNPIGRIVHRFNRDIETIDSMLPRTLVELLGASAALMVTVCIMLVIAPISCMALLPMGYVYYRMQSIVRPAGRETSRLDANARSPLFSQFAESLAGLAVVRAYRAEPWFEAKLLENVRLSCRAFYSVYSVNRWTGLRLEVFGVGVLATGVISILWYGSSVPVALAGFVISYAINVSGLFNWAIRMAAALDGSLVAVERVNHYRAVVPERWGGALPPAVWPAHGEIEIRDLRARYRPGLPLILNGVSLKIKPREKVGFIGRTGSGKSTLFLTLSRILELDSGQILVDGHDISKMDLNSVRSAITVIPQEPVLFSGTIRTNLDPFDQYTDAQLWGALDATQLAGWVRSLPGQINSVVHELGANVSVGQKQLICLARALLKQSKILLMDEATASIDVETDAIVQKVLAKDFAHATICTIAHRRETIRHYDRIVEMAEGTVVRCDTPDRVLLNSKLDQVLN